MKYMLIHCVDESAEGAPGGDQGRPAIEDWLAEMAGRGVLLHGDRLKYVSTATTVRVRSSELLVSDGPFAETKEQVAGYDVIDCADLDEAIEIASKHPTAWWGTIEVRPIAGNHPLSGSRASRSPARDRHRTRGNGHGQPPPGPPALSSPAPPGSTTQAQRNPPATGPSPESDHRPPADPYSAGSDPPR